MSEEPWTRLRGRQAECAMLDELLATVRAGRSSVLVLRGGAGVGKTALLNHGRSGADGCRTVTATGVEPERELAFGGLHQLCLPFLGRIGLLPAPQRDALGTAFGLSAGAPPDHFLVGLAVLGLLADAAAKEPLLCFVDDAQWLDEVSSRTLAFVARRLRAERIGLVLAVREPSVASGWAHLPHLVVRPLGDDDARALLDSVLPGRLDVLVRDRIVAETRGNPRALLELPRGLTPAELAGGFGRPDAWPLAGPTEQDFLDRVEDLPPETRRLLLIAAAEPVGDVTLLNRAAELLSVKVSAASAAETAGLVSIGIRARFRPPLVRSAAYRAATPEELRHVHQALADATTPGSDPDRRAWHLAQATTGTDESVAAELSRSAGRAQARGGFAAAASFLERAAELTPDPAVRGVRALPAARVMYQAGRHDTALALLDAAAISPLDERQFAEVELLRGQITFASQGAGSALPLLLGAAERMEPLDPALVQETYRDAIDAALTISPPPNGPGLRNIARVALVAPPGPPPKCNGLLLRGLATMAVDGYAAGVPLVLRALTAFRTHEIAIEESLGWLPHADRSGEDHR
ncbi:AAA family ATPase [Streptomyces sp. DSM 118878]